MEHYLGQARSLMQQQTSDAVREKVPSPSTGKGLSFKDKQKAGQPFGRPYLEPKCKVGPNAGAEQVVKTKSSEKSRQSCVVHKTCNDDELVKHMSNLPGFLQRVEKQSSIQDKALNFGVLDWKRLEKWKYNERMPGAYTKKISSLSLGSSSFSSTSGPPKVGPNLRSQRPSQGPNPSLLYSGKQPVPRGSRFSSPTRLPPSSRSSHSNFTKENRNAIKHEEVKYVEGTKSKGKETCRQYFQTVESSNIQGQQDKCHQKDKSYDRECSEKNINNSKMKDLNISLKSDKDPSPSDQGKYNFALSSDDGVRVSETKSDMRLDDEKNFRTECCPDESQNIVLLRPKIFPNRRCSESSQFTEPRNSLDEQLAEALANRLSDCFSPYSGEFADDIPHSCPLPSGPPTQSVMEPHNLAAFNAIDLDTSTNGVGDTFTPRKNTRPSLSVEGSDRNHSCRSEQPNVKGRTPSPTRRFSFNLGRMTRSFSFKESSGVPELSSEYSSSKSGPVKPEVSMGRDNFEKDKGNTSGRGRSSPLRRLLDPLLKHKGSPSAEPARRSSGSLYPMTVRTTGPKELPQDRKPAFSKSQALLQLSLKNGLPFFKLVIDNSSEMLAAVVKKLPTSRKSDPCTIYTFYSVHEIRKKSMSWIGQGSKSKSCSLGYNVVGQMKISSSYPLQVKATDSNQYYSRECVLYGVDKEQVDKQTPEFVPAKEIAAIVVKNSSQNLFDGELNDTEMGFPRCVSGETLGTEENISSKGIVVILPSGVHGTPIEGAPSSLISRWRSGGLCDCGGWDVGCKLRILSSDSGKSCKADRLNLFLQGGEKKNKPVFSLEPFSNGFYSIEMGASVSLLEAFATCVAYVTCHKFSEILDTKDQADAALFSEAVTGTGKMKIPDTLQMQFPAKYVTCPPLSPAGRI